MEHTERCWYAAGHATTRDCPAAGTAAPTGHPAVTGGEDSVGRGPGPQRVGEFSVPLVPDVPPEGGRGLRPRPTPGRPPKLSEAQKRHLIKVLLRGPLAAGYRTDLWTLQRVAKVIDREFGIQYHPCHVWKLLTGLGWSCQKPERRALQRDEAAIERWKRKEWPRIKKTACTWGPSRLRRRKRVPAHSQRP